MFKSSNPIYSRLLVHHHWSILILVIFICVILTGIGVVFTEFPDFSDPRIGWGARGKGTIFSQLMVLRHASEKFRLAYELPLDTYELIGAFNQYYNVTVDDLDENSYRSDLLADSDLWKKKNSTNEYYDYQNLNEEFYENDSSDYDEDKINQAPLIYQWHRDRHFDIKNSIIKYIDDKMINITVLKLIQNLPKLGSFSRLPFDLFRPYAYLLEEKYRGRAGKDGMIEFYIERTQTTNDLLTLDHLQSICQWEKIYKKILSFDHMPSLSLATFVALYSSKTDCQLINEIDIENFRSILHTCLPYYLNGYMDIPLSEEFLNRIVIEHQSGEITHQEQVKSVYTTLRHTCFYKNITRFIFDHFLDKNFLNDFQQSKFNSKVSNSMIYISNYQIEKYNRTRDQTMCLRRQPYSRKYCREHGCMDDYNNQFLTLTCLNQAPPLGNCEKYCRCKYQCPNETEQVILLTPILKEEQLIEIFEKNFRNKNNLKKFQDKFIRLIALNLANVREKAAMAQIRKDIFLVALAGGLIVGITVLYFRSISVSFVIVIGATLSIGVSYFIYRVIYRIPIFPFMNLMSTFILIGIGCDDIFVFFDTWEQEKREWLKRNLLKQQSENTDTSLNVHDILLIHQEVKPSESKIFSKAFQFKNTLHTSNESIDIKNSLLTDDALIEIMSNTLKHAASSMFVTSFTTSAAFCTNILTNISFVQVFGLFTGTCIILYFIITVTAIAAFTIIYEKYLRNFFSRIIHIKLTNIATNSLKTFCQCFISICQKIRIYIFGNWIPLIVIKLRFILVFLFLLLGIAGFIGVFYYPKLQVPSTQKVTFFLKDNPMEIYEFSMKTLFNGYSKEERRLFAYPDVSFIFGIRDIDDGYIFDMNDRGHLHLMPIELNRQLTLKFFKDFIEYLGTRTDLFTSNYDLQQDFEAFYQLTSDNILLTKLIDDRSKYNISQTNHLTMIKYLQIINRTIIENLIKETIQSNNQILYNRSLKQLSNSINPIIIYSNYQKSFNDTLIRIYKEQIELHLDMNEIRQLLTSSIRDKLTEDYQRSALKTAMQCLTGAAGENNVPAHFCEQQLSRQRSMNWAVLPDKPSLIDGSVRPFAVIITIRGAFNRTDYHSYNAYYMKVKNFFDPYIKQMAPEHLKHAWFSSPGFAFYGIQRELLHGSFSSLIASLAIALLVLFLTSGNLFIAIYALITITFAIADAVAIFTILKWELGIVEAIIVIMSVGLSVDFVVHFGVGYIHADSVNIKIKRKQISENYSKSIVELNEISEQSLCANNCLRQQENHIERITRVTESVTRVGSAVFMAAFTTFAAGFSMTLSSLSSFRQMGQFLMTIMLTSWIFATFFFLPLCAIIGPVGHCGSIPFIRIGRCLRQCCCRNKTINEVSREKSSQDQ